MDLMSIAVDPAKELHGAEVRPWGDDTVLIIARYNNTPFRVLQNKLMEPLVKGAGRKGITTEEAELVLAKTMAKTVLLGWSGLLIDGKEVEYTPAKCVEILLDPRFMDFKEVVLSESQTLEHYRLQSLEEDLGNSKRSSPTQQGGRRSSKTSSKVSKKRKKKA